MKIRLTINKRRKDELGFYIIMFYFFCLDYLYIAFPGLNLIFNSKLIGIVLMGSVVLIQAKRLIKMPATLFLFYIAAFIFITISMLISEDNRYYIMESVLSLNNLKQIVFLPLAVFFMNSVSEFNTRMYRFSYFALAYYLIIYGLYFVNATIEGGFYSSYGMLLGFQSTFFLLYILQHGFINMNSVDFIFGAIFGLAIISFASRSVIIIMGVSVLVYFYVYIGSGNKVKQLMIMLLISMVSLFLYLNFELFVQLLIKLLSGFSNLGRTLSFLKNTKWLFDSDGRSDIWGVCIDEIRRAPINIRGLGGDVSVLTKKLGSDFYAHNFILELLLEFGIILGSFLVYLYIKMVHRTVCLGDIEKKKALLPFSIMVSTVLFFSLNCWTCPWLWMYIVLYLGWVNAKTKKIYINNKRERFRKNEKILLHSRELL